MLKSPISWSESSQAEPLRPWLRLGLFHFCPFCPFENCSNKSRPNRLRPTFNHLYFNFITPLLLRRNIVRELEVAYPVGTYQMQVILSIAPATTDLVSEEKSTGDDGFRESFVSLSESQIQMNHPKDEPSDRDKWIVPTNTRCKWLRLLWPP